MSVIFQSVLNNAWESGAEVIVALKSSSERFRGMILRLDEETFCLHHSGAAGGILWTLPVNEVAYCGLLIHLPELSHPALDSPSLPTPARRARFPDPPLE